MVDIYISRTNPIPTENDFDIRSINKRPSSIAVGGDTLNKFSCHFIYVNIVSRERMLIKVKIQCGSSGLKNSDAENQKVRGQ